MMEKIKAALLQVFTEPNNHTLCPVRITGVYAVVQAHALVVYSVVAQHAPFDLQAYGLGMGTLLGTLGVALGLKKDSA